MVSGQNCSMPAGKLCTEAEQPRAPAGKSNHFIFQGRMKEQMKKRLLSIVLCLVLALSLLPAAALADGGDDAPEYAAQITTGEGESAVTTKYETLDAAIEAAADGDTIKLLTDCSVDKISVTDGRAITVCGTEEQTVSIHQYLNITGKSTVIFQNCTVNISGQNPYIVFLNGGSVLTLDDADMTLDGKQEDGSRYDAHGIWFESADTMNVCNGSHLVIKNYQQDAMEWDGTSPTLNVLAGEDAQGNPIASSVLLTNCRSGIAGTFNITIKNSSFDVLDNTGNGSNGSNYWITESTVRFRNNGSHGLSANQLHITDSTVEATNNGYNGIVAGNITINAGSHVLVEGNTARGTVSAFHVLYATGRCTIDAGADVRIINNHKSGIQVEKAGAVMTMNAGVVTGNGIDESNEYGGGIRTAGTFVMSGDVRMYNNAASKAGDDLYVYPGGKITFTDEQSDEGLTLTVRCAQKHTIDGWYQDGADARWNADSKPVYAVRYLPGEGEAEGELALKAAHGLKPVDPSDPTALSKSKEATNLKKTGSVYTSDVTLSLPSASYRPSADVVFVLDDTSAGNQIFAGAAGQLLENLSEKENLDINLGIVNFDAVARDWLDATSGGSYSGLISLQDENALNAVKTALNTKLTYENEGQTRKVGGTNIEWPLDMACEMLESGSGTEKYVILFSDLYGYIYRGEMTLEGKTYQDVPVSKRKSGSEMGALWYGIKNEHFSEVLKDAKAAENWDKGDGFFRDSSWDSYWTIYQGVETLPTRLDTSLYDAGDFSGFEKSTCLVYERLQKLAEIADVTVVNNENLNGDTQGKAATIKDEMLEALAGTITVIKTSNTPDAAETANVFAQLQNRLVQLVDVGSKVVDVIGHGTDNKGNTYNFDFVNGADSIQLTVAGEALDKMELTGSELYANCTAAYGFGAQETDNGTFYRFVLRYYENGASASELGCGENVRRECFVLDINEAITKDAPVQLTYTVTLTDPQGASGSYGVYDRFGENGQSALYTNERATIYPVDSEQSAGLPEDFLKPTVSYRIGGGGGGGGGDRKVTLHYVSNGGTEYPDEHYDVGTTVQLDKVPLREDYTFTGWYADKELTQRITSVTLPTDKTVYAGWEQSAVPSMLNSDDHIAYIIGYPQDYRTGEPTADESLWPVQPRGSITRAEVATIFFRLLKADVRDGNLTQDNVFGDVQPGMWFNQPISTMAKLGIVKGRTADAFAPNAPITRAEFASICARFDTGTTSAPDKFSDVKGHWAEAEIARAASLGWIMGYEDGTFRPDQPITRAEAMTMINRVLKRIPETESDLLDGMIVWPDNLPGAWYYLAVQEATNSHDHASKGDLYEHWTKITEAPDWARYEK